MRNLFGTTYAFLIIFIANITTPRPIKYLYNNK